MSNYIPKEQLTAYERWELAAFDESSQVTQQPTSAATPGTTATLSEEELASLHAEALSAAKKSGYDEGFQSGLAAGHAEGLKLAAAETEKIAALGESLTRSIDQIEAQVADELLSLALEIAKQVLRTNIKLKPELILPIVREAMAALAHAHGHPILILNPEDASLVRASLSEQLAHTGWRIIEDPKLERGDCKVESGGSEVDGSIAIRWQQVVEQIGGQSQWMDAWGADSERDQH